MVTMLVGKKPMNQFHGYYRYTNVPNLPRDRPLLLISRPERNPILFYNLCCIDAVTPGLLLRELIIMGGDDGA